MSQKNVPLSHKKVPLDKKRTSYLDTVQQDKQHLGNFFYGTAEQFLGYPISSVAHSFSVARNKERISLALVVPFSHRKKNRYAVVQKNGWN